MALPIIRRLMRRILPIPTQLIKLPTTRIEERLFRTRYLLRSFSFREVARVTGIPTSTLWRTAHGTASLPSKYWSQLNTFYYQESYRKLREVGANVEFARKHRASLAGQVVDFEQRIERVVRGYTRDLWLTEQARLDRLGIQYDPRKLWYDSEKIVRESMRKSTLSPEQWEKDYLAGLAAHL